MTTHRPMTTDEWIKRELAAAPPLTEQQRIDFATIVRDAAIRHAIEQSRNRADQNGFDPPTS